MPAEPETTEGTRIMSYCVDHEALNVILPALAARYPTAVRESECVEFTDPEDGRWYEVVVREIDADQDDNETHVVEEP